MQHIDLIHRLVDDDERDSAECWVINTCTVKSPSQSAMDNLIVKGQTGGKALVVAGCVPQGDRRAKQLLGLSVIGVPQLFPYHQAQYQRWFMQPFLRRISSIDSEQQ